MLMNYLMEKKECNKIGEQLRRVRGKGKEKKNSTECRIFIRLKPYRNKPHSMMQGSEPVQTSIQHQSE